MQHVWAVEVAPRISDREIIEALTEIKAGQQALKENMEERFSALRRWSRAWTSALRRWSRA
ncbi:MAG: hypothetical protein ACREYE_32970 [Gammaproteobacteria bacterium]